MRSEECVIVWGVGEAGEVEMDEFGPAGSIELVLYRALGRSRLDE